MCIVSFDSYGYYGYPASCGTSTVTTTASTTTTTSTSSTTSVYGRVTTVISKTVLGVKFSGVRVKVDARYYVTPFSLPLQGMHTFTAPSTAAISGITCHFLRWEDQWGGVLSTETSMGSFTLGRTFYVVYEPQAYALTIYVKGARTSNVVAGASVYLDSRFVGVTDSRGAVLIQNVYAGSHYLGVTKYALYLPYFAKVNVNANMFTVYLTPT